MWQWWDSTLTVGGAYSMLGSGYTVNGYYCYKTFIFPNDFWHILMSQCFCCHENKYKTFRTLRSSGQFEVLEGLQFEKQSRVFIFLYSSKKWSSSTVTGLHIVLIRNTESVHRYEECSPSVANEHREGRFKGRIQEMKGNSKFKLVALLYLPFSIPHPCVMVYFSSFSWGCALAFVRVVLRVMCSVGPQWEWRVV